MTKTQKANLDTETAKYIRGAIDMLDHDAIARDNLDPAVETIYQAMSQMITKKIETPKIWAELHDYLNQVFMIPSKIGIVDFIAEWKDKVDLKKCNEIAKIIANDNVGECEFTVTEDESIVIYRFIQYFRGINPEVI